MHTAPTDFDDERKAMLSKIFSSIAHDLRTPLTCIIGALGTLDQMEALLSGKQRDQLIKTALSQAQQLDILFGQMLDQAKP